MPENWVQHPEINTEEGSNPGAPLAWGSPENPDDAVAGYGYVPCDTSEVEETFYYHSDHLGSTAYITDQKANVTQYDAYLPYGELLVDEHSSSADLPYKFNGKELDEETGLYYYGARYMNPVTSMWYGVDVMAEKSPNISVYVYCMDNPVRLVDPDGMWSWPWERKSLIRYTGDGVFKLNIKNFSASTRNTFNRMNNDPHYWKAGEIGINTEVGKIEVQPYNSYTLSHKAVGVDPKHACVFMEPSGSIEPVKSIIPNSHKESVYPIGSGVKGAAGAMVALNLVVAGLDEYMILSNFWDSNALEAQTKSLRESRKVVNNNLGIVPAKYRNDKDVMGAIVNYVFQGENSTKNKDVEIIGKKILKKEGRYDNESKKYIPLIKEKK